MNEQAFRSGLCPRHRDVFDDLLAEELCCPVIAGIGPDGDS